MLSCLPDRSVSFVLSYNTHSHLTHSHKQLNTQSIQYPINSINNDSIQSTTQSTNQSTAPDSYRFTNDEIHHRIPLCPVLCAILATPHVQRLRRIRQLGTAEHVYINATHTRFEHSLGVAHLAGELCHCLMRKQPQLGATSKDVLCVQLAGLLHDLGHGPYSHAFEHFLQTVGVDCPHEHVSLQAIHWMLRHLGLEIDPDNLDEPLQQVGDGIDATTLRDADHQVLTSRDWIFIQECIWGKPLPNQSTFIGRPATQLWLYDIVSNRHSGLDVDKMDYFARDQKRTQTGSGQVSRLLLDEAFVGHSNDTPMICYPTKLQQAALDFFTTRKRLHRVVYQHKTVQLSSHMVTDILKLADPYYRLTLGPDQTVPIHDAMFHETSFLRCTDSILDAIEISTDPSLEPARRLLARLRTRDFYKCVGEWKLEMKRPRDQRVWSLSDAEIQREILYGNPRHDDQVLLEDDFVIDRASCHCGRKDQNPLNAMRFLPKDELYRIPLLPQAKGVNEEEYEADLPLSFTTNSIRMICRDPKKSALAHQAFEQWKATLQSSSTATAELTSPGPTMLSQESFDYGDDSHEDDDEYAHYPNEVAYAAHVPEGTSAITPVASKKPRPQYS